MRRFLLYLVILIALADVVWPTNHLNPKFTNLPTEIYIQDTDADMSLIKLDVVDPQGDKTKVYVGNNPSTQAFKLTQNSGDYYLDLKQNPGFDASVKNNYTVNLCVRENKDKNHFTCEDLIIHLVSSYPPDWNGNLDYTINIPENTAIGTRAYLVYAFDPDQDALEYSMVSPAGVNPPNFPFRFDNQTGGFFLTDALDFTTGPTQYTAQFSAYDGVFNKIYGTLTINVIDVNDPPVITGCLDNVTVAENTVTIVGLPMTLFTVQGSDVDVADSVTLSMTCSPDANNECPFQLINQIPGITDQATVVFNSNLAGAIVDYEDIPVYTLTISATDGVNTVSCTVTIDITDVEETPRITNLPAAVEVWEHETDVRELIHVEYYDDEIFKGNATNNDTIEYFMGVYPTNQHSFTIDRYTGQIWLEQNPDLNYEEVNQYELRVWITDGHLPPQSIGVLTVNVVDENDPPNLRNVPKQISIYEGMRSPSDIYVAYAEDEDVGDTITYTMGDVRPTIGGAQFTMDPITGMVTTVQDPNFNWAFWPSYEMDIIATDNHGLTDVKTLTINVVNANRDPTFTVPASTVVADEEGTIGDNIAAVVLAATDPDVTDTLTYSISTATPGGNLFDLDTTGGTPVLQYAGRVDYDTMAQPAVYFLNVIVNDGFGGTDVLPLNVIINNINDNTPTFPSVNYAATFPEDSPVGMSVVAINAYDRDLDNHGEFTYAIDPTNGPALYHFDIDPIDGVLYLKNPVDYEQYTSLTFDLIVTDTGGLTSTSTVTVTIQDVNDNVPYFIPLGIKLYNYEMPFDAGSGYTLGYVEAADKDAGSTVFTYALADNDDGRFSMNPGTALITYVVDGNLTANWTYAVGATATDLTAPNQESNVIPVRIDTYEPCNVLYHIHIGSATPASFTTQTGRDTFTALLGGAIPGAPARLAYIQDGPPHTYGGATTGNVIKFTILFLESDQTDNFWALHKVNKTYYEARTLDELFNAGEGVPSSQLTDALSGYIVEKVEAYDPDFCFPVIPVNWWLDTTEGRTLIAFLSMVLAALVAYLLYLLITKIPWHKLRCKPTCCKKKPPPPKRGRPSTPRGGKHLHDFQYESNKVDPNKDPFTFRRGENRPTDINRALAGNMHPRMF